jgi:gentisate 1,2-dioxygenase
MPYTLQNIKALEDIGPVFDGPAGIEFRAATKPLALEQCALSYQSLPPGARFPYGHAHVTQEEVYVFVSGSGRMKIDDGIVEVTAWDAVRVPAGGVWRSFEAGPDGLELFVFGAPNLGDDARSDVDGQRGWWGGENEPAA